MRGKKIDRSAIRQALRTIKDDDYDGFVLLVRAARNRNVVFDANLPVWRLAQRLGIIMDNRSGIPEFVKQYVISYGRVFT